MCDAAPRLIGRAVGKGRNEGGRILSYAMIGWIEAQGQMGDFSTVLVFLFDSTLPLCLLPFLPLFLLFYLLLFLSHFVSFDFHLVLTSCFALFHHNFPSFSFSPSSSPFAAFYSSLSLLRLSFVVFQLHLHLLPRFLAFY